MFRKTVPPAPVENLLEEHLRERFYVTTKDNSFAFTGLLMHAAKTNYEFADVRVNGQPAAGESLFIDRVNVAYMQRVVEPAVVASATG